MFKESARFDVLGKLGEGGMGVVYEVYDRQRQMRVALKTLRQIDPVSLRFLKNEFRALSDLSHPNIVTQYDLVEEDGAWFLTMEIVEGIDFLSHVRKRGSGPGTEEDSAPFLATSSSDFTSDHAPTESLLNPGRMRPGQGTPAERAQGGALDRADGLVLPHVSERVDLARLRDALAQLTTALHALHLYGLVHRDTSIKTKICLRKGDIAIHRRRTDHAYLPFTH